MGHDLIEVRERAQRRLIGIGMPAVPALKRAVSSTDAETASRARRVWLVIDRAERERDHDASELAELLRLNRPEDPMLWQGRPWTSYKETVGFNMGVRLGNEGAVVYTDCHGFLSRHDGMGGRYGDVHFDLSRVETLEGKTLVVERCDRCSPRQVLVKGHDGPLRITVTGIQTWFSRYEVDFTGPQNGQTREVGDMIVEVQWPKVIVRSKGGLAARTLDRKNLRFTYELKPEAKSSKPTQVIVGPGGHCGGGRRAPPGWCECENGPVTAARSIVESRRFEFRLSAQTGDVALDEVQLIKCEIWKPIEIPIEFTVEVAPVKTED